jgi:hypothetical protein
MIFVAIEHQLYLNKNLIENQKTAIFNSWKISLNQYEGEVINKKFWFNFQSWGLKLYLKYFLIEIKLVVKKGISKMEFLFNLEKQNV